MKKEDNRYEAPTITQLLDGKFIITSLPGAVIRYMKNGNAPTLASPVYDGQPIEVTVKERGLKAKSWLGDNDSKVATFVTRQARTLNLNIFVVDPDPMESAAKKAERAKKAEEEKAAGVQVVKKKKTKEDFTKHELLMKAVFSALRHYRHVCEMSAQRVISAEAALTTWNAKEGREERPERAHVHELMAEIYQKEKGHPIEAYIEKEAPSWMSHLKQSCRRQVDSTLAAGDPEIPTLSRRDRIHGHERLPPRFNGVGLPILCSGTTGGYVEWNGLHRVKLRWDNELKWVEFGVCGKRTKSETGNISSGLDPKQAYILKKILSGEYQQGTSQIMAHDSQLVLAITYSFIPQPRERDKTRILEVVFTDDKEKFLKAKLDGSSSHRGVVDLEWSAATSAIAAIDHIHRLKIQSDHVEKIREACGSFRERKRGAGVPKAYLAVRGRGDRLSRGRNNTVKTWNHRWTSQIVNWAISRDCGVVKVYGVPKLLFGWQWQFADFKSKLQYKADTEDIEIIFLGDPDIGLAADGKVKLS